jgi:hypothetical protein
MMLAIGLSYRALITLRFIPSIPSFLRSFIIKWCWILWKAFSASIEMIRCCSLCFCWYVVSHVMICICWTITAFLGWSDLVMGNDLSDILLDSVCHYFIEDFCIDAH